MFFLCLLAGRPGSKQKTHDRFQPWVLVEINFNNDKRQRRRLLQRRQPGQLVLGLSTSQQNLSAIPFAGQVLNSENLRGLGRVFSFS